MSKDKIESLVAYKKKLRKSILKNYQALKEKISLLKHHELKELVSEWNFDSEELDNDLLSLDTDELRNNYLEPLEEYNQHFLLVFEEQCHCFLFYH